MNRNNNNNNSRKATRPAVQRRDKTQVTVKGKPNSVAGHKKNPKVSFGKRALSTMVRQPSAVRSTAVARPNLTHV